ncbi:MAG: pyridoxamine 5'-phosphate oxidase family protein [Candidatus Dormibacteraeota bacterium]|nr:pyridoxamine 5'-phosphate oxidase family protein [Candidatus Dormibacteraeota bacterium]
MTAMHTGEEAGREPEMEVLDEPECYRLLRSNRVGRVVVVGQGRPEVFPVNYGVHERLIAFRTGPGLKVLAEAMWAAAFEVDGIDQTAGVAWSVIVHGVAHQEGPDGPNAEALRDLGLETMAPGEKDRWVTIHPTEVTGRRFHVRG